MSILGEHICSKKSEVVRKPPFHKNPYIFLENTSKFAQKIKNLHKTTTFLLPPQALDPISKQPTSKEVTFNDVHAECLEHFSHDFKCKPVTKHFAFHVPGVKVPQTSEYLNVIIVIDPRKICSRKLLEKLKFI